MSAWPRRALADCGVILAGGTPSKAVKRFWGGDIPWISAKSLKSFILRDSEDRLTPEGAAQVATAKPGSILFVVRGMSLANEFRVGIAGRPVAFNQDLRALRPSPDIHPPYLARYLRAIEATILGLTDEASHGTKRLTSDRLAAIDVPVPPLAEQRRIADILDSADAMRAKRREAIALLSRLPSTSFGNLFEQERSLAWPLVRLVDCVEEIQIGPFGSLLHEADYVRGGLPIVNPKHINEGRIVPGEESIDQKKARELSSYRMRPGDVVLARRGEMGRCAVVTQKEDGFLCGTGSMLVRPKAGVTTGAFVGAALAAPRGRRWLEASALGITLLNLNSEVVSSFPIRLPPIDLQLAYSRGLAAIDKLKVAHRASLAEMDALFASLQHRAFRGEL